VIQFLLLFEISAGLETKQYKITPFPVLLIKSTDLEFFIHSMTPRVMEYRECSLDSLIPTQYYLASLKDKRGS